MPSLHLPFRGKIKDAYKTVFCISSLRKQWIKKRQAKACRFLAAEEGFEPSQTESESVVLTVTLFGNIFLTPMILSHSPLFVNGFPKFLR